jgi:tetratricopeptide (TPR) repeat protein
MIRFSCPQCHTTFQVKDETAGRKTKCPKCRAAISIPLTIPCDPPPFAPPEAAAVADEAGDLSRETAAPNSVDFWDTLPAPVEVTSTPLRGPANAPRRQKRQLAPGRRSGRRSLVYLCMGGMLLVAIGVAATLWMAGFLSRARGQRAEQANAGEVASSVTGAGIAPVKNTPAPANAPGSGQHDSFQTIYLQGQKLLDDGELDQAIGSFDKAIQLKPDAATAYNARAVAYLRQHRLARALSDFEQAIHLDPKLAKYYANRGLVHRDQEKYDLAIADFSKAIELSPSTPDLYDERAETIVFKNDMKQTPASQGDHATAERLRKGKTSTVPLTDVANASSDKSASTVSRTKSVALLPPPTEAAIKSDPRFAETDARIRETNAACAEKVKPLETKHKRLASQRKSASRSKGRTALTRAEKLAQEDDAVVKEIQAIEKERVQKVRQMFNEFCAATGHEPYTSMTGSDGCGIATK